MSPSHRTSPPHFDLDFKVIVLFFLFDWQARGQVSYSVWQQFLFFYIIYSFVWIQYFEQWLIYSLDTKDSYDWNSLSPMIESLNL